MSIHANEFQWTPGVNDKDYIIALEGALDGWREVNGKAMKKIHEQADQISQLMKERDKAIEILMSNGFCQEAASILIGK